MYKLLKNIAIIFEIAALVVTFAVAIMLKVTPPTN